MTPATTVRALVAAFLVVLASVFLVRLGLPLAVQGLLVGGLLGSILLVVLVQPLDREPPGHQRTGQSR